MAIEQGIQDVLRPIRGMLVIPCYNNAPKLPAVLDEALKYTHEILVINDGSTDETPEILRKYANIRVIHFKKNRGKGSAIQQAFEFANQSGFDYVITMDGDGQHAPEDLPHFVEFIREFPRCLVVGSRNMDQAGIPGKSSFGNKFSNFWFRVNTGLKLPDTQSGYRCYPVDPLAGMRFFTRRFEFEIEVLVRAVWKGVSVKSVPVAVDYPEDRISHFRPVRDFFRISILNTVLVFLAVLWYRPWMWIREMKKKSFRQFLVKHILALQESNRTKALSVGVGLFMGIVPVWGYQMALALVIAHALKLNKFLTLVASNISIPPMIPLIVYISLLLGSWITGQEVQWKEIVAFDWAAISDSLLTYMLGSFILAVALGVTGGLLTYLSLSLFRKNIPPPKAETHG